MKKILVTGARGQLGKAIQNADKGHLDMEFTYLDVEDLDLRDEAAVLKWFGTHPFDYLVNCAAYTAVDAAEKNQDEAFALNRDIPALLGKICRVSGCRMIHISTDYVFDGSQCTPYLETSEPRPLSVYGRSKLAGEKALWDNPCATIIRSSWLYSEFGSNFVKTVIRLAKERKKISVVCDQVGTPTSANDLAKAILSIIRNSEAAAYLPGVYNYSGEGLCSWYDFAWEITRGMSLDCEVIPLTTDEYPLPAKRPCYSVLHKGKIKKTFGIEIPYWKESLMKTLAILANN